MASNTILVKIKRHGYSDNPTYDDLIYKLAQLAGAWRGTRDEATARQYQTILKTLVIMGFNDELPVEVELPEDLMPVEYIQLFD